MSAGERLWARVRSWLRAVTGRGRLETEMEEEMRFHLEARAADLMREGMDAREAMRQARVEFGGLESHKDGVRRSLGLRWWDELWTDLKYGTRILRSNPGFTAIAVGSLALAIGANTTIFSLANELLYAQLGVPHAEQLRLLVRRSGKNSVAHGMWGNGYEDKNGNFLSQTFSYPIYRQLRKENRVLEDLFAFKRIGRVNVTVGGDAQSVQAELVSGNFYTQMQVKPLLGRPIEESDDAVPGSGAVAMISEGFWERAFGRSADVIGKTITVNMNPVTVVGVNPRGFTGANEVQSSPEVFLPLSMIPRLMAPFGHGPMLENTDFWWVQMMGRERPGVSTVQAQAALDATLNAAVRATIKVKQGEEIPHLVLEDGSRGLNRSARQFAKPMYVLMTLAGLVLLLACANTANLLLARAAARMREMTVRLALGASRGRVLRQVLTESLMLSAMGGVCGLALGYLARNTLPRLMVSAWERNDLNVPFDLRVFGFTAGVTIMTGLLFGLIPAWKATRSNIGSGLKAGSQTATRRRGAWGGKTIVAFQLALSTLLIVGAGLFLRTLIRLYSVDPGFRTDHLVLFSIAPPNERYAAPKDVELHRRLEEKLRSVPGVQGLTLSNPAMLAENMSNSYFLPEGVTDASISTHDNSSVAMLADVGADFFQVMGITVVAGRNFNAQDTETSQPVMIINRTLAKQFFPNTDPIGKRVRLERETDGVKWIEIIGVCADTRYSSLREEVPAVHFDLYRQQKHVGAMTYIVRTQMPPEAIVPSLRSAVQQIDRDLPLMDVRTQQQQIDATMQQERTFASLTVGFGVLALALACVGIYGIMAYTVSQRTNEIGIRLALGAQRGQVRGMVLRETALLALLGVVAGLAAALGLARLVKSMLYGLQPADPVSLIVSAGLLLAVAMMAAWVPAARASRVAPMEALRHE